jgi:DNA-binding CsgD family transcriptional regulator
VEQPAVSAISTPPSAGPIDLADVLMRLADLGPPSEIRNQSPKLAAGAVGLDRVLLSSVEGGVLTPEAIHVSGGGAPKMLAALREQPHRLDYPLIEGEIMRRRRAQVVRVAGEQTRGRFAFAHVLGWSEYAATPLALDGRVIGFFHGDRQASGGTVEDADALGLASFAACFGIVYERAVLRHRLRVQHHEMRQMANWADARTSDLGDRSITLDDDTGGSPLGMVVRSAGIGEPALRELLTRRELEVLKLMVRGETNAGIARDLVVSEGTVKFHVKNILRKMHAANRAEATSRYLRLTLNRTRQD